jgi:septum formation inhibitor MinC
MEQEAILKFLNLQKGKHTLTLRNGEVVRGGETFEANLSDVPEAFRDTVRIISVGEGPEAKAQNKEVTKLESRAKAPVIEETGTEQVLDETIEETCAKEEQSEVDKKDETPAKTYTKKHIGKGKYDVLDADGTVQNETPLTGAKAQQLIDSLTETK